MKYSEGLAAWLRLTLIPGIGGETQRKLLAAFGLPEAVFAAGRLAARSVVGHRADLLFDFDASEAVDRSIAWADQAGQYIITLADTSCGYGCFANLPDGASGFTTIELKSNHLGTAREGAIECTARAAHRGRNTQVWDATVTHRETQRTIALFRCTQMVLYPR